MAATPKFDGARISADVKDMASDAYEGRSPATAGEEKTVAYLSKQFAAAGLQQAHRDQVDDEARGGDHQHAGGSDLLRLAETRA
ncbi:hypothetical protein G6F63_016625 [Rhizopus arrhizus]|nr:hypothetical protein G6F63_016625 [Rhizopus arrhizus]